MHFSLVEKTPLTNDHIVLHFCREIETQASDLYNISWF